MKHAYWSHHWSLWLIHIGLSNKKRISAGHMGISADFNICLKAWDNFCVKWTQTTARFFRMVYSRILISILCQIEWLCQSYRSTSMFCWYRPSIESKLRKRRLNQKYMGFRWYGTRKRFDSPMFMKASQYILIFLWVHVASLAQW